MPDSLVAYYTSGEAIRSRSVSDVVLVGTVNVPAPPARLAADWNKEISQRLDLGLGLEPGDVEALPLHRARARWPDYKRCVQAVTDWLQAHGIYDIQDKSNVALMACRGARYHHDGAQYGGAAFCNLFMSEDLGLDLHFPSTGHRIALTRGTVVLFDTGLPHGVIQRDSAGFKVADFPPERDCTQVFLTWELPIQRAAVACKLGIDFDSQPALALIVGEEQTQLGGVRVDVCPESGRWCTAGRA